MAPESIALVGVPDPWTPVLARAAEQRALVALPLGQARPSEVVAALVHGGGSAGTLLARIGAARRALRAAPFVLLVADGVPPRPHSGSLSAHDSVRFEQPAAPAAERAVRAAVRAAHETQLDLVGTSAAMRALRDEIRMAASAPSTVLLLGETGSGKGVAARAVHALSERRSRPFVHVDCAALAPSVLESELFGHERGAFTGAATRRVGRLELAAHGTLFLDEIGELDIALQGKLLRALEERRFERVGGCSTHAMSARVIAGTNRDLEEEVRCGRFRRDLFFRLDVLRLRVPPLRERLDDLPALVDHLLARSVRRLDRPAPQIHTGLLQALRHYSWPGNVRELANRLEALAVRARGETLIASELGPWPPRALSAAHRPVDSRPQRERAATRPPADTDARAVRDARGAPARLQDWEQRERDCLVALLDECGGNVARVARRFGRPRSTVRYKILRYGLDPRVPRG